MESRPTLSTWEKSPRVYAPMLSISSSGLAARRPLKQLSRKPEEKTTQTTLSTEISVRRNSEKSWTGTSTNTFCVPNVNFLKCTCRSLEKKSQESVTLALS